LFPADLKLPPQKEPNQGKSLDGMSKKFQSHEWIHSKLHFTFAGIKTGFI